MKATRARRVAALLAIAASGYLTLATSNCRYEYELQVELELEASQAPTTMLASARSDYTVLRWSIWAPAGATLSYLDAEPQTPGPDAGLARVVPSSDGTENVLMIECAAAGCDDLYFSVQAQPGQERVELTAVAELDIADCGKPTADIRLVALSESTL